MIEIRVYKTSNDYGKANKCFCQRINLVGIDIPYAALTDSLHFIYGQGCIIEFVLL